MAPKDKPENHFHIVNNNTNTNVNQNAIIFKIVIAISLAIVTYFIFFNGESTNNNTPQENAAKVTGGKG